MKTPHLSPHGHAQPSGTLLASADLLVLLTTFWIAKDWLMSPADRYPYATAAVMTLPALAAFLVGIAAISRGLMHVLMFLIVALIFLASCTTTLLAVSVAAFTYSVLWLAGRYVKGRSTFISLLIVLEGVIIIFLIRSGIFFVHVTDGFDPLLGNGIGTCSDPLLPFAVRVAFEIGIPGVAFAVLLLLTAAGVGVSGALRDREGAGIPQRRPLACLSVSVLTGFVAVAAIDSMASVAAQIACSAGVWTALAGILAAARPAHSQKPRSSRPTIAGMVASCVIVVGLVWAHVETARLVEPYAGGRWDRATGHVLLSNISQPMQDATIAMEDGHFYAHHGFDWKAIHRALRADIRGGKIEQGGSTITQQLATNLFLSSDRTIWRKLEEAALAWQLERMLSKRRILELYLNTIDYGMGQRGISNASQYYFHKLPKQLTLPESAILVGCVPDPMHQNLNLERVSEGERHALIRMAYFYPQAYSQRDINDAINIPLDRLIYPEKDAWDRGATHSIPGVWHGVGFYFFADPKNPLQIGQVAACFKDRLADFLDDAHKNLHLCGIDHLGLYNDRTTRFSNADLSAHAFGQALDMSGFRFTDGTHIKVADHRIPSVMNRLAPIERMLNSHFDAVVDWHDNPLHDNHFHVEVKGPRSTALRPPTADGF